MPPPPGPPSVEPAFSGVFSRNFLLFALLALLGALLLRAWGARGAFGRPVEPRVVTPRGDLADDERSAIELFEAASRSVVHIETSRARTLQGRIPEGSGTGFVWDEAGHIVTNYHVIQDASFYSVRMRGGRVWPARLVGYAPDFDLAVLRIDAPPSDAPPLPLGTSADLRVGQKAFAIGNPFGLEQTLTTGVVSGLNRSIESRGDFLIHGVIQTDAAINPGNSGGPLLDSAGRLIGVNTAIASPSGAYAGVGFAVAVDTVNRVVPRILAEGVVQRAILGVTPGDDLWARDLGIEGAVVDYVVPGGPADQAGLRGVRERRSGELVVGDVIVAIDGRPVRGKEDLYLALEEYGDGDTVRLRVSRPSDGTREWVDVDVTLRELR